METEICVYLSNVECLGGAEDENPLGIIQSMHKISIFLIHKFSPLHHNFILLSLFLQFIARNRTAGIS
jgi:hypothetical protein